MIVKLWDKTEMIVSKDAAAQIEQQLLLPEAQRPGFLRINGALIATSAIAAVTPGGYTEADKIDASHRLEAPKQPELTDEQRAKNLEKLAQIRRDFIKRKADREAKKDNRKTTP